MATAKKIGNYVMTKTIGEGAYSKVKLGINTETKERVAIKVMKKHALVESGMVAEVKREIKILKLVQHPNVVNLVEVLASPTKMYLVQELITGGELFWLILTEGAMDPDVARDYMHQLVNGVRYLHSVGICHRDIKPENLLLTANNVLKITDFGLSNHMYENDADDEDIAHREKKMLHTTCGTLHYAAPEEVRGLVVLTAQYLQSNGFVMRDDLPYVCAPDLQFLTLAAELPFEDENEDILRQKIKNATVHFPNTLPSDAIVLLKKILVAEPEARASIEDILADPWFQVGYEKDKALLVSRDDASLETHLVDEPVQVSVKFTNAFELIGMSGALDMQRLLRKIRKETHLMKSVTRFMSNESPEVILDFLKKLVDSMPVKVKMERGASMMRVMGRGKKGIVAFTIEVSQVTSSRNLVDFRRMRGSIPDFYSKYKEISAQCQPIKSAGSTQDLSDMRSATSASSSSSNPFSSAPEPGSAARSTSDPPQSGAPLSKSSPVPVASRPSRKWSNMLSKSPKEKDSAELSSSTPKRSLLGASLDSLMGILPRSQSRSSPANDRKKEKKGDQSRSATSEGGE